jgi:hypothetical protein
VSELKDRALKYADTVYPNADAETLWGLDEVTEYVRQEIAASATREVALRDAAEMLWTVVANVSGGDWTKQPQDWQDATARWRDNYFEAIKPSLAQDILREHDL